MTKVFITGATGQVGYQVANYLLSEKRLGISHPSDIICLIRNPAKAQSLVSQGITLVKGDLQDSDTIFETMNLSLIHISEPTRPY